ncbi:hypothetical protein WN943_007789 [Citrus x changshan-huyou]
MEALGQDADDVEVKNTIFSMPPMKAPGIDGLHGIFFQSQWELVGPSMCKLVKQICFAGKVPAKTPIPILVFEYGEYRTLPERIGHYRDPQPRPQFEPLRLKHRLKMAIDIAHALAYLHVGFPRPIVFRHFIPSRILFNEENVAKLFDFSLSISIPEGKTHVTHRGMGIWELCAPDYKKIYVFNETLVINEKYDVYTFETPIPILVFEYGEYRTLPKRFGHYRDPQPRPQFEPLRLKHRLKIAIDIAHALAYLHVGFPRPIVFRHFIPSRILFNEENVAKLFDFSLSISIPEEAYISVQILLEKLQHGLSRDQASHRPQPSRLKIARDIANSLAYLHFGFPRPIVFRNVKTENILFNEENVAKFFDFSLSISIPEGAHFPIHRCTVYGVAAHLFGSEFAAKNCKYILIAASSLLSFSFCLQYIRFLPAN